VVWSGNATICPLTKASGAGLQMRTAAAWSGWARREVAINSARVKTLAEVCGRGVQSLGAESKPTGWHRHPTNVGDGAGWIADEDRTG